MKNWQGASLTALISGLILIVLFWKVLEHPNAFVYSHGEDGVKSYFNFSYYLKYDSGIKHDGINYPYGDHLQYINSHPLYVQVVKIADRFIDVSDHGVAIMNLTMIVLFWLCFVFLYLILRHFKLPKWYAVICALIIGFMSPQLERIGGHFEMVYAVFIPMFWYFLLRFENSDRAKWLWASLLILSGLIGGFTSAYFVAFYSIFLIAYIIAKALLQKGNRKLSRYLIILIMALLPLIIVRSVVGFTDWVDDRPDNPWGFYVFYSNFASIFYPKYSPFSFVLPLHYQWEGKAYIGLIPTLILLYLLVSFVIRNLTSKPMLSALKRTNFTELQVYLLAGVIVLAFAMCIPFKWGIFRFMLDLIPPIKQFRALGRFSWVFYYTASVFCAQYLYSIWQSNKAKHAGYSIHLLFVLSLLFWSFDAAANVKQSIKHIFNQNRVLQAEDKVYDEFLDEHQISIDDYQGIYCLPFASTCGDKLLFERGLKAFKQGMRCSYRSSIPLIQSFSPRLSYANALSSIQLLADEMIYKVRLDDMNDKPILLIKTNEALNDDERKLLLQGDKLGTLDNVEYWKLDVSLINKGYRDWFTHVNIQTDSLEQIEKDLYASQNEGPIVHNNFDGMDSKCHFYSPGANYKKKGTITLVDNIEVDHAGDFEVSFWLYVDHRTHNMPQAKWYAISNDQTIEEKLESREVHDVVDKWIRVSKNIQMKPGVKYKLEVSGKFITADQLLIRPLASDVYETSGEQAFWNNYPVIDHH